MELDDDFDRKALFIQKEKELLEELNTVKNRISHSFNFATKGIFVS